MSQETQAIASRTGREPDPAGPAWVQKAVTPADGTDLPDGAAASLYVGGAGDVVVVDAYGNQVTWACQAGTYIFLRVARVKSTNTTATGIIALY